jgi:hypothetical protein
VAYGRVRVIRDPDFQRENAAGALGSQDVLVLERAPRDIEGVVAGW